MKIWRNKSSKIASVFPVSWFSKLKTKSCDSEISSVNKERLDFPTPKGRIYNIHEDDAYWSLSFRKDDRVEGRRSTGGINTFSYVDHDEVQVAGGGQNRNFDDMVLDFKKLKEKQHKERVSRKNEGGERLIFAIEPEDTVKNVSKYKDIKVKTEPHGKNAKKKNIGVKSYSPRTECKVKAIEEMRKAKMKMKKKLPKEQGKTVFDSFAVVKSSVDPHRDFRDSMVEMIIEKGIRRPRELEKLLACYLELNSDEFHHLIIKVFRQVWFDLNGMSAAL